LLTRLKRPTYDVPCRQHNLHFIADEIYLGSDYSHELTGQPSQYVSCLTLKIRRPNYFHFLWAFSKVRRLAC